jgi:alanine-synthesizing transaminase
MNLLPEYLFGRLNALKLAMRRDGRDVIDFGMGNPDQPANDRIVDKTISVLQDTKAHRYSMAKGIPHLRKAVADHYKRRYDVDLEPETEVITTIGSKEGLSHLSLALLGPGDSCLVPAPAFPVHIWSAVIAGASVITIPLGQDAEFLNNLEKTATGMKPRPKILFLNYPHNPTTAVTDIEFLTSVVALCRKLGILIVQDFAYKDITYDGYIAPSILQVPGAKDLCVEFLTMSKSYNMAGWRCGFCVGNRHMIQLLGQIKGYYDYGLFTPIQVASIEALNQPDEEIQKLRDKYQERRDVLVDGLARGGWVIEKPKGAMFVWAQLPEKFREMGSMAFSELLLNKAEVLVSPGIAFGDEGEGYVRMSLVENTERIRQAVRQINRVLAEYTK